MSEDKKAEATEAVEEEKTATTVAEQAETAEADEAKEDAKADADDKGDAAEKAPSKKRLGRKGAITLGVVAAVVVVAAIGLFVWHEQPSFCSAICHTPMDSYLPTYEAEPGQQAVDKWGNQIPDAAGMMAATHRVEGTDCLDCHVPTIGEQVSEGISWVSGNYEIYNMGSYSNVMMERSLTDLTEARGIANEEFCLNSGCHNMTREQLEESTADMAFNPHKASGHGAVDCGTCHKAHRQSVMYCTKCHDAAMANLPEGWISYQEAQALEAA